MQTLTIPETFLLQDTGLDTILKPLFCHALQAVETQMFIQPTRGCFACCTPTHRPNRQTGVVKKDNTEIYVSAE